ncbi:MAG: Kae1-associated kinase Bud32 [Caldisphaera sp.]|nr:Kae1-associated kinase Bud32 [Caldisphaera sp.]
MVLFNAVNLIEKMQSFKLIKRGAESEIRLGEFLDRIAIYKIRVKKEYMDNNLDFELRQLRTRKEAKILVEAYRNKVNVPIIYSVFPSIGTIIMQYIEGITLKNELLINSINSINYAYETGKELGLLHLSNITHGDSTTSNVIIKENKIYLIDFGLAEFSSQIEDKAVDIHLFKRAVESTHAPISKEVFKSFIDGYKEIIGLPMANSIIERANDIELRGRYVEIRKKSVWK